jgi:hypothetical protein
MDRRNGIEMVWAGFLEVFLGDVVMNYIFVSTPQKSSEYLLCDATPLAMRSASKTCFSVGTVTTPSVSNILGKG